jgi:hypothetical protein
MDALSLTPTGDRDMAAQSNKITRLKQQLAEAEMHAAAAETPDPRFGYHDNVDAINHRDNLARKLQAAIDRSRNPGIFARLLAWVMWPVTN